MLFFPWPQRRSGTVVRTAHRAQAIWKPLKLLARGQLFGAKSGHSHIRHKDSPQAGIQPLPEKVETP